MQDDLNTTQPQITLSLSNTMSLDNIEPLYSDLTGADIAIKVENRKNDHYMGLELLMPFGLVLIIAKPYFDGFMQKAGADHYDLLVKGIKKLYHKFFGKDPELFYGICRGGKLLESPFSFSFSIVFESYDSGKVRLVFHKDCSEDDFYESISVLSRLLKENYGKRGNDEFGLKLKANINEVNRHMRVIVYKSETNSFDEIDVIQSSKTGQVVSRVIIELGKYK